LQENNAQGNDEYSFHCILQFTYAIMHICLILKGKDNFMAHHENVSDSLTLD
jgi:hypothetical protein